MPVALTAKAVESVKAGSSRKEIPDGALQGLYLIVQPSGVKSWAVRYRHATKPRKMTLGGYPALTLADARKEAQKALRMVSEGRDPATEKAEDDNARPAHMDLVPAVLDEFVTRYVEVKNSQSYIDETKRIIEADLKPAWKQKLIKAVTKRDVLRLLDGIVDRGAPIMANRVRALLSKFFAWCVERDIIEFSPMTSIKPPSKEKTRDRVLSDDEIALVLKACEAVGAPFGPMVKMLFFTGQRRTEVAGARFAELEIEGNNQLWVIPPERAKNKKEHFVPLTSAVLDLVSSLPRIAPAEGEKAVFLFTTNGKTAVSGFSKAKKAVDNAMIGILRETAMMEGKEPEKVRFEPWTFHDIRRTVASGMARLNVAVHVVEAVLNHRSGSIRGVAAVYNRYDYAEEKRAALTEWAGFLGNITAERQRSD
ncbi:integrase arm-type DNA-binding domain-containing protein [Rhizobium rhizogenes]|uniref:tyrosine-type recombinase/integrase n=1 Tax=Rhizobium rhizogenes TaxID=359 RepID=UPI0022BB3608|nr:integrase arm-type DNA-binding domain-containing protein [Rhizobium rhizogenes]MCZ7488554.1 integrase arm-type DNA-binding domain-containing protein [Rhizobium rhizogenes]